MFELQAYDQLTEKWSEFGSHTIQIVKAFFKQPEFKDDLTAIANYAKWATERGRSALWRVPSPEGMTPGDADYTGRIDSYYWSAWLTY